MQPKRVLQAGLTSNLGGTETFIMNLYRNIDRSRIQFDFIVDHDKQLPFEDEIESLGGRVYHEYYYMKEKGAQGYITPLEFLKSHPEIDAVHVNVQNINTLFRILSAAKKLDISKRILHAHSAGSPARNLKQKVYESYARLMMDGAVTKKLACSDEAANFIFRSKNGYQVIPNAIDVCRFAFSEEKRSEIRQKIGVTDENIVIGFAGSFNYQKNPEFAVNILDECRKINPAYKLLMLGQGVLFENIQEQINERGLAEHIICIGNQPNVNDYMSAMDLFLLPSKMEGFGIVLLEAQAEGLKCVTSKGVVPKTTNVTGNVTYLPLENGAKYWAEQIAALDIQRFDGQETLSGSEYNIVSMVKIMEKIYLDD